MPPGAIPQKDLIPETYGYPPASPPPLLAARTKKYAQIPFGGKNMYLSLSTSSSQAPMAPTVLDGGGHYYY